MSLAAALGTKLAERISSQVDFTQAKNRLGEVRNKEENMRTMSEMQ